MLACWKVIQWMPVAFPIRRYSFSTVHPPPGEGWNFQTSPSHIHHQSLPFVGTTGCPWQYGPQVPHEITGRSSGSAPSSGSSPQAPRLSGWWLSLPRFTLLFTMPQSRAPRQRSTTKSTAPPQVVSIPLDLGSQPPCSQPVKKAQSLKHCKEPPNSMKWLSFLFKIFITFISFASSPTKSSSTWKRKNIPTTKVQTTARDPQPPHRKDLCASESAQIALPAWISVGALSLHLYGNKSSTTFHEIRVLVFLSDTVLQKATSVSQSPG